MTQCQPDGCGRLFSWHMGHLALLDSKLIAQTGSPKSLFSCRASCLVLSKLFCVFILTFPECFYSHEYTNLVNQWNTGLLTSPVVITNTQTIRIPATIYWMLALWWPLPLIWLSHRSFIINQINKLCLVLFYRWENWGIEISTTCLWSPGQVINYIWILCCLPPPSML